MIFALPKVGISIAVNRDRRAGKRRSGRESEAMNRIRRDFRNERDRHDHYEQPLPLYLPIPEPMPLMPNPSKKENDEKTERGIWIIDI